MSSFSVGGHSPLRPGATLIVGLGASAGGLEALEQFLTNVPIASGLAYVVVQHLDPTRKAMLSELLQRVTALPVRDATESVRVEPNVVYVIPSNCELTVADGLLHLGHSAQPRGLRLPIDVLFSSLARDQGERAIGVVLSGMGSDGTLGLLAIKSRGGLGLAQSPESAQFDSMPMNAIAAGCVDIVGAPAELPQRILLVTAATATAPPLPQNATDDPSASLQIILDLMRNHSKHDFSMYKPSTLVRRIQRRLAVHGLSAMAEYEALVRRNPQELDLLFAEMLIGVTHFFRDPSVWQELKGLVLPALLKSHGESARLRAWVVGCSTGEEAYSLAMIFREVIEALPQYKSCTLQIFATDLSAEAIAAARRGLYPTRVASEMDEQRLARFFSVQPGGYLVDKCVRETVLFAQHDVILDPPFTKLDILSCRNVLIYFNAALQSRLMPLFHYSLRASGVLVLGTSETVGRSHSLFSPLSPKSRLFRRSENSTGASSVDFPIKRHVLTHGSAQEYNMPQPLNPLTNLQTLADQVLLKDFAPPAVLVNKRGDVIYVSGRTGKYLEPAAGKANWNIHVMARVGIRTQLVVALREALLESHPIHLHSLKVEDDDLRTVDVTVQAVHEPKALEGMVMIVFRELVSPPTGARKRRRPAGPVDPAIADELARAREEIRALRQEMGASQEELQAANEELQSTNEEVQSANEELTTSKEEAQSMNEELQTINGELQSKLDDLALAQSDMQNLLNSTDIATLFLDNELNVRRFTEQATRVFHLREGDVGRPLSDLASTLTYPQLIADVKETIRTLAFCERQVPTTDGHWYSMRIMPYRTLANVIQGAVITFVDITAAKELESRLRKA